MTATFSLLRLPVLKSLAPDYKHKVFITLYPVEMETATLALLRERPETVEVIMRIDFQGPRTRLSAARSADFVKILMWLFS
jgi:hypothetical protein